MPTFRPASGYFIANEPLNVLSAHEPHLETHLRFPTKNRVSVPSVMPPQKTKSLPGKAGEKNSEGKLIQGTKLTGNVAVQVGFRQSTLLQQKPIQ